MVTGGVSYNALLYGAYDTLDTKHPDDLSYEKSGGFGLFQLSYLDTHFGTRGREGRLIQLIG
jgi:cyanophycinase